MHTVAIELRPEAEGIAEPFLWGRNRLARLRIVETFGYATRSGVTVVSLDAYSKREGDGSPCNLSNLSPADARAIAAALIAAADDAEKE